MTVMTANLVLGEMQALSILWNKVVGNVQLARSNQKTQKDWNADTKKDDDYVARIDLLNIKNL